MCFSWSPRPLSPDDDDDTVKDVVGVAKVIKETKSSKFQDHLQGKHAGKDNIADLQDVGQFLWLERMQIQRVRTERALKLWEIKHHPSQETEFVGSCKFPWVRLDWSWIATLALHFLCRFATFITDYISNIFFKLFLLEAIRSFTAIHTARTDQASPTSHPISHSHGCFILCKELEYFLRESKIGWFVVNLFLQEFLPLRFPQVAGAFSFFLKFWKQENSSPSSSKHYCTNLPLSPLFFCFSVFLSSFPHQTLGMH